MKTAIIVYSFSGNNMRLATYIQNRLSADLYVIDESKKKSGLSIFFDIAFNRTPSIKAPFHIDGSYDHYVFISPIWAGRIASPLKAFLKREAESLVVPYSFVSVCGGGDNGQSVKIEKELKALIGHQPIASLEISVSKLLSGVKDRSPKMISAYRINEQDLLSFASELNHFIAQVKSPELEFVQHVK